MCFMKNNLLNQKNNFINLKWKNHWGIIIFLLLMVRLIIMMPKSPSEMSDTWSTLFYAIDYKTMGFVPRAFVGSVCSLFFDYISEQTVYIIALCATIVLIAIASLLIGKVIKKQSGYESIVFLFMISAFLLAPCDVHYLFGCDHMGINDLYFIMLTILAVICSTHKIGRWFIPLICVVCMAIYEGYPFAFGALIGIILLYMICKSEKKAAPIIITILTILVVAASFLYFYIFFRADYLDTIKFDTLEQTVEALSKRTEIQVPSYMFEQFYFWDSAMSLFTDGRWNVSEIWESTRTIRKTCMPTFLIMFTASCSLWISSFRSEENKFLKFIYLFCVLAPLSSLPLFLLSEQLKYISYNIFTQLILVGFFSLKEKAFLKSSEKIGKFLRNNPLLMPVGWLIVILSGTFF